MGLGFRGLGLRGLGFGVKALGFRLSHSLCHSCAFPEAAELASALLAVKELK